MEIDYGSLPRRDVMCIDCKCFFASVESVKRGLHPLESYLCVVSHAENQHGLVLAASPKMKSEYQIKTGSRMKDIPRWDKRIIIAKPRMALYLKVNEMINDVFKQYVMEEDWHPYSIDETFIDVTRSKLFGSRTEIAHKIQSDIWRQFKLPLCIGIGDNPLLAKLCLDNDAKNLPPYIANWTYEDVSTKLWRISPITNMWGIGYRMAQRLEKLGIRTIRQLAHSDIDTLKRHLGKIGEELYYHANGVDLSVISQKHITKSKSIGLGQTLRSEYVTIQQIHIIIREMVEHLAYRLRKQSFETQCISVSVKYSSQAMERGFSHQLQIEATHNNALLQRHFVQLFDQYYGGQPLKGLYLSCSRLVKGVGKQLNLFEDIEKQMKLECLDMTLDKIRERYGYSSLVYASSLCEGATGIQRSELIGGHKG